ncbi:uncharacterized protein C7orf50 homolog [Engraulis encrasicolus]|uniref:uncharacterized protein C7orf50 homolog n=1 Tax=Engraulis encrasicolus TaxID=184585 RepID=UPI002FD0F31C
MVVKTKSDPSKMKKNKTMKDKKGRQETKVSGKHKRKKTDDTEERPEVLPKKLKKQTVQAEPEEKPEHVNEEDLTPEEKRVLERKMKKILKKEEKRRKQEEGSGEEKQEDQSKSAERALEYLTCWSERREEWRFKKIRQTWLLQHMYDTEKVPDASFSVMLAYLENLRGAARDVTVEQAEAVVKEDQGDASQSADQQKRIQRALEVVRLLA